MKTKLLKNSKGLTLIEMLTVIAIAGIIALASTQGLVDAIRVYNRQAREARLSANLRQALNRMTEEVREGRGLASTYTDGTHTYNLGSNTLIVNVPAIDGTGRPLREINPLILPTTSDKFVYFIDNVDNPDDPSDNSSNPDGGDPGNPKLRLIVAPAPSTIIPFFPGSFRTAVPFPGAIISDRVHNLNLGQVLFREYQTNGVPNLASETVVVRLYLHNVYRGRNIDADAETSITMRNFGN